MLVRSLPGVLSIMGIKSFAFRSHVVLIGAIGTVQACSAERASHSQEKSEDSLVMGSARELVVAKELGSCPPPSSGSIVGRTSIDTSYIQYRWDCPSFVPGPLTNATAIEGTGVVPQAGTIASAYAYQGHVDIASTRALLQGNVLSVIGTRPNYVSNGDFGSATACTTTAGYGSKIGNWASAASLTATANSGNCKMQLGSGQDLTQGFPARKGDVFTVAFDFDGSNMYANEPFPNASLQRLYPRLYHLDSAGTNLDIYYPSAGLINANTSKFVALAPFRKDDVVGRKAFKVRAADDNTVSASGISVNQCNTTNLSATATAPACNSTAHLAIAFAMESGTGTATVDNVRVDLDNGIEVEILDAVSGATLQSSTIDEGFLVDLPSWAKGSTPSATYAISNVTVRVHLRSRLADAYPVVRALRISDAFDITATKGSLVRNFSSERMGIGQMWEGPPSQLVDTTLAAVPSECRTSSSEASTNCFKYFVDKKLPLRKFFMDMSWLKATWIPALNDYKLSISTAGTPNGEFYLQNRIARSMRTYGYRGTMLLVNNGSMYGSDGVLHTLDDFSTQGVYATQDALTKALIVKYATFVAQLFDGAHYYSATCDFGFGTCSYAYPTFSEFELFGEVNGGAAGFGPTWSSAAPARGRMSALANDVGSAIRAVRPTAIVTTPGIHGGYEPSARIFDSEFVSAVTDSSLTSPPWSKTTMNAFAFHPYLETRPPEEIPARWDTMMAAFSANGWSTSLPAYLQEWGIHHEVYNPHCSDGSGTSLVYSAAASNGTWSRGLGKQAHGKLFARYTLLNLSLPVTNIMPYGVTTPGGQGGRRHSCVSVDPADPSCYGCWESDAGYNFTMFDRVPGTGPVEGGTTTIFEANEAGKAYVTAAQYISKSSPYASTVSIPNVVARSSNDQYQTTLYKTGTNGWVVGAWWTRHYLYGDDWMNYMWGASDEGFTGLRKHNIAVPGFATIASATLVPLDGSATSSLTVKKLADGTQVIQGATFGERPVLIKVVTEDGGVMVGTKAGAGIGQNE